ncbi:unnamed protein product [Lota lota]
MWAYKRVCPTCGCSLTGAGLYRTVRRVLDTSGWYFMGTEHLECCSCKTRYAVWAQSITGQLNLAHQERFPAILTYKLSCDKTVIGFLRECTLGNSASCLRATLVEQHTREWMTRAMAYLTVLKRLGVPGVAQQREVSLPPMQPVPTVTWLLSVYVRDALTRLTETKARVTSVFGKILKMDSTKKMTKKLEGRAARTAAWVTNVGNEHGQVLMSVLADSEGDGLTAMTAGLVPRGRKGPSSGAAASMFGEWDQLMVRLDVWHLMRRFARGVTTDSHQLYGVFMARLSFAIFEWDRSDVECLTEARQAEEGMEARISLTAKELARHCTRGAEETERLVQEVLDSFAGLTDTMGVPLIDEARMAQIWITQGHHLVCILDTPGELTGWGVRLPCLSLRQRLDVPGVVSPPPVPLHFVCTSASALHFQVYLLEGLVRWNENRARTALLRRPAAARLQPAHRIVPGSDAGELIGVEYLYFQTGAVLPDDLGEDPDVPDGTEEVEEEQDEGDEGFTEEPEDMQLPAAAAAATEEDTVFQMTKKLAGRATRTAAWVTNVGNEHGQVLMCVLTDSEGDGLFIITNIFVLFR